MVDNLRRTPEDFSKHGFTEFENSDDLKKKELYLNQAEQLTIKNRMDVTKNYLQSLHHEDPNTVLLKAQMRADKIELDELRIREEKLSESLNKGKKDGSY